LTENHPFNPRNQTMHRRDFLATSSSATALAVAAASGFTPARAADAPGWNPAAFDAKTLADVAQALGATSAPLESADLTLQAPDIAENGAVVRVSARSALAGTTQMALLVEKNPAALAALFDIPGGTEAQVATNLKMAESSRVYVLARVGGQYLYAVKEVKVTLGGCGGA
jgi:sulfur-oxidizing protein SoxY